MQAGPPPVALIDLVQTPINSLQMRALKSRAVVIQRQPATFEVMRFIAWCRQIGIPTYFDIDDQIFDARISPLPIEDYAGRIPHETHVHLQFDCAYFREAIKESSARLEPEQLLKNPWIISTTAITGVLALWLLYAYKFDWFDVKKVYHIMQNPWNKG